MIKKILNVCLTVVLVTVFFLTSQIGWTPLSPYIQEVSSGEAESAERLKQMVAVLSEDIGVRSHARYKNLLASADYIAGLFEGLGCKVERQSYKSGGKTFQNIIAQYSNLNPDKATVVLGAHYDTHYNPGADDNASGVAGVIELVRLLRGVPLNYNLKFIAFTNEEPPFFRSKSMGSRIYVEAAQSAGENIRGAIILEMLGYYSEEPFSQQYLPLLGPFYPNKANFIAIVGNFHSRHLVKDVYSDFREGKHFPVERIVAPESIEGIGFSDHSSFWKAGIPAVMVTDTAYLRNPNYHRMTDRVSTLDFSKMAKVIHGLKTAIIGLD